MTNTITISTTERDLWGSFFDLRIEGIKATFPLEKKDAGENRVYKIFVHIGSEVAIGLFVAWLAEHMTNHPESVTKIENQRVTKNHGQITNVIMEHVTINNYYGEKQPKHERVPEE